MPHSIAQPDAGQPSRLPETGIGSLATRGSRIAALLIDWGASMLLAVLAFGPGVLTGGGWRAWMTMTLYFIDKAVLTALTGSSLGQLVVGIGVTGVDGHAVGIARSFARPALICVVLPAVLIGPGRRALDDVLLGTVVVRRRA